jgi:flagellar biosynthesis component FlhA
MANSFSNYLPLAPLVIQVGNRLAPWVEPVGEKKKSRFLDDLIPLLRSGTAWELGLPVPAVSVRGYNPDEMSPDEFEILLYEKPVFKGKIPFSCFLVRAPREFLERENIEHHHTVHPLDGSELFWIPSFHPTRDFHQLARRQEWSQWDVGEFFILVLSRVIREHSERFLPLSVVYQIVEDFRKSHPNFAEDVLRRHVTMTTLADVFKILVREKTGIRDLDTIFEVIARDGDLSLSAEQLARRIQKKMSVAHPVESSSPSPTPKAPVPLLLESPEGPPSISISSSSEETPMGPEKEKS